MSGAADGGQRPETPEQAAVRQVLQALDACWRDRRYEDLGALVDEQAVIAPPDKAPRVRGRETHIESYRAYNHVAVTHAFTPNPPVIDIVGSTAVGVRSFRVMYEIEGVTHPERGEEILILA